MTQDPNNKPGSSHKQYDSVASMESEMGGHEQLRNILIEHNEPEIQGEEVVIFETLNIIKQSGGDGNYQKLALLGLLIPAISIFFIIVMMPAMQVIPNVLCTNGDTDYIPCTIDAACKPGIRYMLDRSKSIANWVYDFGLLCDSASLLKLIYYFFFGGFCAGSILLAPLADYYGRKSMIIISVILLCLVHLKAVFTNDVLTCAVVLCLSGAFVGMFYCVSITYLTEIAMQELAVIYSVLFHLSFPLSAITVAILLRYFRDWKVTTSIMSLIPLVVIAYSSYIAESPRFLVSKGMYNDARIASNIISTCNTGKMKKWLFDYEKAKYMKEYEIFAEERSNKIFQHSYFMQFASGRYYIIAFSLLLFCSGFAFSGLALEQKLLFKNPFVNDLILYMIEGAILFIAGYLIQMFGHIKTIGLSLIISGGLALVSTIFLWISDYGHGVCGYLTKLFAFISFVGSLSFAAENCPSRVRATGFGIVVGAGAFGLMMGGFVLEFHNNLHILFGIVAVCGIFAFTMVKEPSMYLNNDDIHEINELRKNNYKEDTVVERKQTHVIRPVSENEASPIQAQNQPKKSAIDVVLYKVKGKRNVDDMEQDLGIDLLNVYMNGKISYEGKDVLGEYSIEGSLSSGHKLELNKKYKDGSQSKYEGERKGAIMSGVWTSGEKTGKFEMSFPLKLWTGSIKQDQNELKIEWYLGQAGRKLYGLGETNNIAFFIAGMIDSENKVLLIVSNENSNVIEIEGILDKENNFTGKFKDGTLTIHEEK